MKVKDAMRWMNWGIVAWLLILAVWLALETWRGAPAHYGLYQNTPQERIVILPGRAVVSYYLFLVSVSLLPVVWFCRSAVSGGRTAPVIAAVVSLATSSLLAGFAFETLQSEIELTLTRLGYRAGGRNVSIPWSDIQAIAVRTHSRSQWIEILGAQDLVRVDLGPFALPDKRMLVDQLPRIAKLSAVPRKLPDGWVWRRSAGIHIPE